MKNVELTYSEHIRIIAALGHEREEAEDSVKFWTDKADSSVEKKSRYERYARDQLRRLDEINRIIDKLSAE